MTIDGAANLKLLNRRFPGLLAAIQPLAVPRPLMPLGGSYPTVAIEAPDLGTVRASAVDPDAQTRRDAARHGLHGRDLLVVGVGTGYHLQALLDQRPVESLCAMILNPDIFVWALQNSRVINPLLRDPRVRLIAPEFGNLDPGRAGSLFIHRNAALCCPHTALRDRLLGLRQHLEIDTEMAGSMEANEAANRNRREHYRDVAVLAGSRPGSTVFILLGGPSVDAYLPILNRRGPETVLIACSTVARKLVRAGVRCDLFTFIEPNDVPIQHFEGIYDQPVPLVAYLHSQHRVLERYQGPVYLASHAEDPKPWPSGTLFSKGNVAHLATTLAIHLGAAEVAFLGADLGFSGETFYCEDAGVSRRTGSATREIQVRGVTGAPIPTSLVFHTARRNLEALIARHKAVRFTNLGQTGAWIEGARHLDYGQAERRYFAAARPAPSAGR